LQAIVNRQGHEDILKLRLEKIMPEIGSSQWEQNFKTTFREICTVKIDQIEYVDAGIIGPQEKMLIDERQW
jgi:phenylacetate-CoA ligase